MKKRSDTSWSIAICVSLLAHFGLIIGLVYNHITSLNDELVYQAPLNPPIARVLSAYTTAEKTAELTFDRQVPLTEMLASAEDAFTIDGQRPVAVRAIDSGTWEIESATIIHPGSKWAITRQPSFAATLIKSPQSGTFADPPIAAAPNVPMSPIASLVPAPRPETSGIPPKPPQQPNFPQPLKPPPKDEPDWGEKNTQGTAFNSTPGKSPLMARKGQEDQSFSSRDPEGPGPLPDQPSKSLAPPGEGGDGQKPSPQIAAKPPEAPAPITPEKPTEQPAPEKPNPNKPTKPEVAALSPPPPAVERINPAAIASGAAPSQTDGDARDILPAPRESTEPQPVPALEAVGPYETASPNARPMQILPAPESRLIAIESASAGWPTEVDALTRPPGPENSIGRLQPIPEIASADVPTAPDVQSAIIPLVPARRPPDLLAKRAGQPSHDEPEMADALLNPPGNQAATGMRQPLPDLVTADVEGAPELIEAAAQLMPVRPPPDLALETIANTSVTPEVPKPAKDPTEAVASAQAPPDPTVTPVKPTPPAPKPQQIASSAATGGLPGAPAPAADAARDADLESDPFSKTPNIEFRDGKIEARNGRKVKPIRPRLTDVARRDLLSLQFPTIVAKVRIDKTGKVTDVTVLRGSGSEAVDMPVYRALWDWWFEPPVDKAGNPLPDVQLISIHWG